MQKPLGRETGIVLEWAEEPADWDRLVREHPWGTVYHLTAWRRVIEEAFPHIKGRFLLLRLSGNGRLLGGMPIYKVNNWLLGSRLVSIPFASFCDPLVADGACLGLLVEEAWRAAQMQGAPKLEVRLYKSGGLAKESGLGPTLYSRHHYASLQRPEAEIWASFSKTSVRQCVTRAERSGVHVSSGMEGAALSDFLRMLAETRRRRALPFIPSGFFEAMKRHMFPEHLSCWIARDRSGKSVAGLLGWRLGDRFTVEYSGEFPEARQLGASQYLYWHVMRHVRDAGCRSFSFGRTGLDNPGLRRYKLHWGTLEEDLKILLLPENRADRPGQSSMVYRIGKFIMVHSPPLLNRLIGEFYYRYSG